MSEPRWIDVAAPAEKLPYILIENAGGGDTNDSPRSTYEANYRIYAVANEQQMARQISGAIYQALHHKDIPMPMGWSCYRIARDGSYADALTAGNIVRWLKGGVFGVRVAEIKPSLQGDQYG